MQIKSFVISNSGLPVSMPSGRTVGFPQNVEYLVNGTDTSKNKNAQSEEDLHLFRKYQKLIQKCESLSPQKTELLATIADNFEKK